MKEKGPNYFLINQETARRIKAQEQGKTTKEKKIVFADKLREFYNNCIKTNKFQANHILTVPEICEALGIKRTDFFNQIQHLFPERSVLQILEDLDLPYQKMPNTETENFSKESIYSWFIETARNNNRKPPNQQQVSQAVKDGLLPPSEKFKQITRQTPAEYAKNFKAKVEVGEITL